MGRIHNTDKPPGRRGRRGKGKKKPNPPPNPHGKLKWDPPSLCARCRRIETHADPRGAPSSSLTPHLRPARSTRSASCAACRVNQCSPSAPSRLRAWVRHLRPRAATARPLAPRRRPPPRSSPPSQKKPPAHLKTTEAFSQRARPQRRERGKNGLTTPRGLNYFTSEINLKLMSN